MLSICCFGNSGNQPSGLSIVSYSIVAALAVVVLIIGAVGVARGLSPDPMLAPRGYLPVLVLGSIFTLFFAVDAILASTACFCR